MRLCRRSWFADCGGPILNRRRPASFVRQMRICFDESRSCGCSIRRHRRRQARAGPQSDLAGGESACRGQRRYDFEHLGLHISPDADTLMYTLAGLDNTKLGWGRRDETWSFMETLTALGVED